MYVVKLRAKKDAVAVTNVFDAKGNPLTLTIRIGSADRGRASVAIETDRSVVLKRQIENESGGDDGDNGSSGVGNN
jgi:hypothetical protein